MCRVEPAGESHKEGGTCGEIGQTGERTGGGGLRKEEDEKGRRKPRWKELVDHRSKRRKKGEEWAKEQGRNVERSGRVPGAPRTG